LDDGFLVDAILLDQSKALDKVQHQLLLLKVEAYRVHEDIVAWIEAFLTKRAQKVVVMMPPVKPRHLHATVKGVMISKVVTSQMGSISNVS
jgi:hypothetical protein